MSFWKRIFRRGAEEVSKVADEAEKKLDEKIADKEPETDAREQSEAADAEASAAAGDADKEDLERENKRLQRLRLVGRNGGCDVSEAIAILRAHEGMPHQSRYLDAIIEGMTDDPALDPLRVACASLLDARGQRLEALRLVSVSRSVAGMMLAAELYASSGKLPRAVSMIERVLARDIDTPGARERHERWSEQLGRRPRDLRVDDGATVVAPQVKSAVYRLIRETARGGAGTVYEAEDELLGRRVAYKVYHRTDKHTAQIERESRTAVQLTGPGVLRIYDVDLNDGWLASEWIARGSLRDILKDGRVGEVLPMTGWLPALLFGLARVHDEGLVHSDVKPANVLFRALDDPLLGDFGICQPDGEPALSGTPGYMSPERLDGGEADPRDDVYAVGRVIEDVLGARDDSGLTDGEEDARRWARVALACMADVDTRPTNAHAVLELMREEQSDGEVSQ